MCGAARVGGADGASSGRALHRDAVGILEDARAPCRRRAPGANSWSSENFLFINSSTFVVLSHTSRRRLHAACVRTIKMESTQPLTRVVADAHDAEPCAVSYGVASDNTSKGEDFYCAVTNMAVQAFAVFDGHSGADAAAHCSETLCQALVTRADASADDAARQRIIDEFWAADARTGTVGTQQSGTTCTLLLVEPVNNDSSLRCQLAWVGDSTAVCFDMNDPSDFIASADHSPTCDAERAALATLSAVRAGVMDRGETLADAASSALGGHRTATKAELDVYSRALHRVAAIEAAIPDGAEQRRAALVIKRPPRPHHLRGGREGSNGQRTTTKRSGPTVVATATTHEDPHYYDVAMTRSIGDWLGSSMVLPHPSCRAFDVPAGTWTRIVIASDGLWDVCEQELATRAAREYATAQEAAEALLALAHVEYLERKNKTVVGDDTTIMVVDLNPSLLQFSSRSCWERCWSDFICG